MLPRLLVGTTRGWDGTGYHRGERAPSVPPAARVLAVADVFAALTEPRPHRPAFSAVAAANILRQEAAGGRLDSLAVEAVLGRRLGITPKTADHHIQHVYAKIGVRTRAAATVFAMQHDLVARG
jgi:HD-GYP domain-containing protein (c-di-GMP phosphodiesterase class II)